MRTGQHMAKNNIESDQQSVKPVSQYLDKMLSVVEESSTFRMALINDNMVNTLKAYGEVIHQTCKRAKSTFTRLIKIFIIFIIQLKQCYIQQIRYIM